MPPRNAQVAIGFRVVNAEHVVGIYESRRVVRLANVGVDELQVRRTTFRSLPYAKRKNIQPPRCHHVGITEESGTSGIDVCRGESRRARSYPKTLRKLVLS
jgi:hypothetical protein